MSDPTAVHAADERGRVPLSDLMVTEPCDLRRHALDILCVGCGWTAHAEPKDAPWPLFQGHRCTERRSGGAS